MRILIVVFLALFAAGTVIHEASAMSVSAKMAMAGGNMSSPDCDACGDDGGMSVCDLLCLTSMVAVDPYHGGPVRSVAEDPSPPVTAGGADRRLSPDPQPPRTIILT